MKQLSEKTSKCLPKTIKAYSYPLSDDDFEALSQLAVNYGKCRSMFFNQFSSFKYMAETKSFRAVRNRLRKESLGTKYVKQYNFLGKHWVYALMDTCTNVQSMWSNTANQIRYVIRQNKNVDDDERHLLCFLLSKRELWLGVLKYDKFFAGTTIKDRKHLKELEDAVPSKTVRHAFSYLRRLTRRYKAKPKKKGNHNRSMTYDENMYHFDPEHVGNFNVVNISSGKNRKTFTLVLTSQWHYSLHGNIQIVLDRDQKRVEIHKLISTHVKPQKTKINKIGIDKGLATLVSCSTDNEYGKKFSDTTRPLIEKQSKRLAHRNPYYGHRYALRKKIADLNQLKTSIQANLDLSTEQRKTAKAKINARIAKFKYSLLKIENHNLGHKRYRSSHNRQRAYMNSLISHAVYQMLRQEKPQEIVKEDLTWTKEKLPKTGNRFERKMRKNLATWAKGYLNERIEYLCQKYDIAFHDINPAYTSQFCPQCGARFEERIGSHHEIVVCPNCGKVNANTSAAKNILNRLGDPEITLYTPYKKVEKILEDRIKKAA